MHADRQAIEDPAKPRAPVTARILPVIGIPLVIIAGGAGGRSPAAEAPEKAPPAREGERDLGRELEELEARLELLEQRLANAPGTDSPRARLAGEEEEASGAGVRLTPFFERESLETPPPFRGIYDKPFLLSVWRRAHVGGYTELEYHSFEDGIQQIPEGFRMHRTNVFFFTDVADTVRFAAEIEFETEFEGRENSSDIEVAVEMAFVDWVIFEEFAFRGGAILPPLGRINVNHDGPIREFTERPLVSTFVIPTTLTEAGVGAHGAFQLGEPVALTYEAYAVNGFDILDADGELAAPVTARERLLREGRTSLGGDVNDAPATAGRVGLEVSERLEIGGSWHFGTYDERGDNFLSIFAGDLAFTYAIFSLEGEIAVADFQRDSFARTAGVPDVFWGYYIQGSASGMPRVLRDAAPFLFGGEGATFALALRYDWVDLAGDRAEIIEPGINFRPVADTVLKFSYRLSRNSFGLRGVPGTETFDDEGFVFSLSSYF